MLKRITAVMLAAVLMMTVQAFSRVPEGRALLSAEEDDGWEVIDRDEEEEDDDGWEVIDRDEEDPEEEAPADGEDDGWEVIGEDEEDPEEEEEDPEEEDGLIPCVPAYQAASDLSNVVDGEHYRYYSDEWKQMISDYGFVVGNMFANEFFEIYENNRYDNFPSFITVDSVMHSYHLFFSCLLNKIEKNYLVSDLLTLSRQMLSQAEEQYELLEGTEWEEAARNNLIYFAVPCAILDEDTKVKREYREEVYAYLDLIEEASQMGTGIDYTQFQPRGYYAGDTELEKYFKAMSWYGQICFSLKEEKIDETREAVLIASGISEESMELWNRIYSVTAFFAGDSDNPGLSEYRECALDAFGEIESAADLAGKDEEFEACYEALQELPQSVIAPQNQGFRFMGMRFTLDSAVFQNLISDAVLENEEGELRTLPDGLDIPAALGSGTAQEILEEKGSFEFENYRENLEDAQEMLGELSEEDWQKNLYSSWLYTLTPLLSEKREGYPSFMQSGLWSRKNLESFLGSYTELKHDTVLYSKQSMAEGGGEIIPDYDTRGYAEPEPEVYRRIKALSEQTKEGLLELEVLSEEDEALIDSLSEIADTLLVISEKELLCEELTDEEYEYIRTYGQRIEEFWIESTRFHDPEANVDYPMNAINQHVNCQTIADISYCPDTGEILEVGTGKISQIYVAFPIDGEIHIGIGGVLTYYEFVSDERLTDAEWREMLGGMVIDDYTYLPDTGFPQPEWAEEYRLSRK